MVTFNKLGQWSVQSPGERVLSILKLKNNINSEEKPAISETTSRDGLPISVRQEELLSTLKRNEVANASYPGRISDGEAGNTIMMSEDKKKLSIKEMVEMENKIMPKTAEQKRELMAEVPHKKDRIKFELDSDKKDPNDSL